jgi:ribose/xylose/arabinose/galactoside ABC-type transport system permease subunit
VSLRGVHQTESAPPRALDAPRLRARGRSLDRVLEQYGLYVALLLLMGLFTVLSPAFLTIDNALSVLRQISTVGIMAVGEGAVILAGGIDVSVGSVVGLGGMTAALALRDWGAAPAVATTLGVLSGLAVGLMNGLVITRLRVNPFVTTLAMLSAVRGIVYVVSNQYDVRFPELAPFLFLGRGYVGPIPFAVVILAVVTVFAGLVESHTTLGRSIHALGGNESATRLSGVPVDRVRLATYAVSGACAGLGGVITTSQIAIAVPYQGSGLELDVIAAVVVGGISLSGGMGRVLLAVVGAVFIGVLANGMALLDVPNIWQLVIKGLAIVLAVALYNTAGARRA